MSIFHELGTQKHLCHVRSLGICLFKVITYSRNEGAICEGTDYMIFYPKIVLKTWSKNMA
jgi:hypothetical protein